MNIFHKLFERELWISIQITTLLKTFCEFMLFFEIIIKSVIGPDDSFQEQFKA